MSAFPIALDAFLPGGIQRPTASTVLASLRARRQEAGKGGNLALRLGEEEPVRAGEEQGQGGLSALHLPGAVTELSALPGAGALTLALRLLDIAGKEAHAASRPAWLCVVDPTRTLHAPAVAALGVALEKLVVLQPPSDRLLRTAVRAGRSGAFAGILVDGSALGDVSGLVTGVRRLTLAAEEHHIACVLLTSSRARRGLPLPVAARALVESVPTPVPSPAPTPMWGARREELHVRFLRHRHGPMPRLVLR
jgi:hypothetical protein